LLSFVIHLIRARLIKHVLISGVSRASNGLLAAKTQFIQANLLHNFNVSMHQRRAQLSLAKTALQVDKIIAQNAHQTKHAVVNRLLSLEVCQEGLRSYKGVA
jgi:hypothetical protein